jgi:hypothetical protein
MATMRTSAPPLALAALALVLAGCGGADQTASGTSAASPSTPTPAAGVTHPTGADDVVVRVWTGGGFVPVEVNLAGVPTYTLYGDGTVIRAAPAPAAKATSLAGSPAPQPLETGHLDEAAVQQLLGQAKGAGLLAPGAIDYGDMGSVGVSDMPTTTVTFATDGATVDRAAYALGGGDIPGGHNLSAAQQSARAALSGFVALTEGSLADAEPYVPERLAVFVAPGLEQPDVATDGEPAELPLTADLTALTQAGANSAAGFGCTVVDGDAVPKLLAAVANPSPSGLWRAAGGHEAYRVVVRPLLPDEAGCPA